MRLQLSILLAIALVVPGCKSHSEANESGIFYKSYRPSDPDKRPEASLVKEIRFGDPSVRAKALETLINKRDFSPSVKYGVLSKYATLDEKKLHLKKAIEGLDWNSVFIGAVVAASDKPLLSILKGNPGYERTVKKGMKGESIACLEFSDSDLDAMDLAMKLDVCEIESWVDQGEKDKAVNGAKALLDSNPNSEALVELYVVSVFHCQGFAKAADALKPLRNRLKDADRLARLDKLVLPPNTMVLTGPNVETKVFRH